MKVTFAKINGRVFVDARDFIGTLQEAAANDIPKAYKDVIKQIIKDINIYVEKQENSEN